MEGENERLARLEESCKTAHHSIDCLENLDKLVMYAGVNNIELSGYDDNGAEPIIELDYYIDYNDLTNSLLELGGE